MRSNVKRNGVNFRPFDALEGYKEALNMTDYNYLKEEKIILSPDQIEEINNIIKEGFNDSKMITIRYFKDGYYKYHTGYLKKIDTRLYFKDGFKVLKENIVEAF